MFHIICLKMIKTDTRTDTHTHIYKTEEYLLVYNTVELLPIALANVGW